MDFTPARLVSQWLRMLHLVVSKKYLKKKKKKSGFKDW